MDRFINLALLREPYNWIIVILMLAISVFALNLLAEPLATLRGAQTIVA
jgi:hypothetical protein